MPSYTLTINNEKKVVSADPQTPMLWILRDLLGLNGTKFGCGKGLCGACTIHYSGRAIRSCTFPVASALDGDITTIEGLSKEESHPIQLAWKFMDVPQCGYCQSGQIMSAAALISVNETPTDIEINEAMAGNICRCGTYMRIRKAIKFATSQINQ